MTFQISRRGKPLLESAQTLLRAVRTMTDSVIADQLKALADDYQRRAEKIFGRSAAERRQEGGPANETFSGRARSLGRSA